MVISTSQKGAKMQVKDIRVDNKIVLNVTDAIWVLEALYAKKDEVKTQLINSTERTESFELSIYLDKYDLLIEQFRKEIYVDTE